MWMNRCRIGAVLLAGIGLAQATATALLPGQEPTQKTLPAATLGPVVPTGEPTTQAPPITFERDERRPRIWGSAEYLLSWIKNGPQAFPLATTGSPTDPTPGALGQPNTRVLFGGNGLDYGAISGMRLTIGRWSDSDQTIGWEASGFLLQQRVVGFSALSDGRGNPPIYLPLVRPLNNNAEGSFTISDALLLGGVGKDLYISSHSQLWGAELNGLVNLRRFSDRGSLDFLFGFRYLGLNEDLTFSTLLNDRTGIYTQNEGFTTTNQFYGGQFGARAFRRWDNFYGELTGKVALGDSHQIVDIYGTTVQATPTGAINVFRGAIFTMPSNIGRNSSDVFAVAPELQVKAGVYLSANVKAFVSYNFLYLSSVVRPGDQIDRTVNDTQAAGLPLIGPARPAPLFNRSDFWSQSVAFGLELKY